MTTREQIVAEALTWVGTPWHRNQSLKGVGADCIGVVGGIALAVGLRHKNGKKFVYRNDYSQRPDGSFLGHLKHAMVEVTGEPLPGDVILMLCGKWRYPHHVAIYIGDDIVHAFTQVRRCVRQRYDSFWRSKTRGIFRFGELA